MKKLRRICIAIATILMSVFALSSCMLVQSQKMENVKGTYKLTSYTYRPAYDSGKTPPNTINYVQDRGYERYLVVTGSSEGYFVHKDNDTPAYSMKVQISYEYDTEDTSLISYVYYKESASAEASKLAVTRDSFNYSVPSITLFGRVTSETSISWKKVDKATDLSYVKTQLPDVREYDFGEKEVEGVYSAYGPYWENNASAAQENPVNPYVYYFTEIDAFTKQARIVYLKTEEGSVEVREEPKPITLVNGWDEIQIGDETWTRVVGWNDRYAVIRPAEGAQDGSTVKYEFSMVRADIGDEVLAELIAESLPTPEVTE